GAADEKETLSPSGTFSSTASGRARAGGGGGGGGMHSGRLGSLTPASHAGIAPVTNVISFSSNLPPPHPGHLVPVTASSTTTVSMRPPPLVVANSLDFSGLPQRRESDDDVVDDN